LLDAFLRLPHLKVELAGYIGNVRITVADFTRLSGACKSLVLMPQWEFLNFLEDQARRYPAGTRRSASAPAWEVEYLGAPMDVLWIRLTC
jgi:hypothetical protein